MFKQVVNVIVRDQKAIYSKWQNKYLGKYIIFNKEIIGTYLLLNSGNERKIPDKNGTLPVNLVVPGSNVPTNAK